MAARCNLTLTLITHKTNQMLGLRSVADVADAREAARPECPRKSSRMRSVTCSIALPRLPELDAIITAVTKMRHSSSVNDIRLAFALSSIKLAARREPRRPIGRSRSPRAALSRGCGTPARQECGFRRPQARRGVALTRSISSLTCCSKASGSHEQIRLEDDEEISVVLLRAEPRTRQQPERLHDQSEAKSPYSRQRAAARRAAPGRDRVSGARRHRSRPLPATALPDARGMPNRFP